MAQNRSWNLNLMLGIGLTTNVDSRLCFDKLWRFSGLIGNGILGDLVMFTEKTSVKGLWILFKVYGYHEAAVEICDRANNGDTDAMPYREKIWNKEF
jgi:hypothetical protein